MTQRSRGDRERDRAPSFAETAKLGAAHQAGQAAVAMAFAALGVSAPLRKVLDDIAEWTGGSSSAGGTWRDPADPDAGPVPDGGTDPIAGAPGVDQGFDGGDQPYFYEEIVYEEWTFEYTEPASDWSEGTLDVDYFEAPGAEPVWFEPTPYDGFDAFDGSDGYDGSGQPLDAGPPIFDDGGVDWGLA